MSVGWARADRDRPLVTSFGQRLWFTAQLDPGSPVYYTVTSVRLATPVDVGALELGVGGIGRAP